MLHVDTQAATAPAETSRAARLNVTIRPETYARLQEARSRPGWQINVSEVTDIAINSALDKIENPQRAVTLARLRIETDIRRGDAYRWGHQEGERWSRDVASWAEICRYAYLYDVRDVTVMETSDGIFLCGQFEPPRDYPHAPLYEDSNGQLVGAAESCEQYWRGWLDAVVEVFQEIMPDLAPIIPDGVEVHKPGPALQDVDPDDIPF